MTSEDRSAPGPLRPAESWRRGAIVLVHGAWVGEWSWLPVLDRLGAGGRTVHPVSLTGHGTRRARSGPAVTLVDHVADVVDHVETLDLTEITLVGHSYGGRVISRAADRLRGRLAALVYLDAHCPVTDDPGQSPARRAEAEANGGMLPFPDEYRPDEAHVGGPEGVRWFLDRTMPHSFACLTDAWGSPLPAEVRKTFVFATGYRPTRFEGYARICAADDDWAYHEIDGPHFLMMSHPAEVTRIILDA